MRPFYNFARVAANEVVPVLLTLLTKQDEDAAEQASTDLFAKAAGERRALLAQALGDVKRLAAGGSVQARCLECAGLGPSATSAGDARLLDLLLARIGW